MLDIFRRYSGGIIAKLILALLIASFAVWGIGDMLRTGGTQQEAARVGSTSFSVQDIRQAMQPDIQDIRKKLGKHYNPAFLKQLGLTQQVLDRMVSQELMRQEIERLGIRISDAFIADMVRHNPLFFGKDNKFNKDVFQATLRQYNLTESQYTSNVRHEMAARLLSQAIMASGSVPDIMVKVLLAATKEKRTVEIYTVNTADINVAEPTDAELKEYYQSVSSRYAIPEYRTVRYVTLTKDHIGEISFTDEEIAAAYTERKAQFETPETRSFEQLLYTARADAESALTLLKSGQSFAAVAKKHPPMNQGNTAIKNVTSEGLPEELRDPAFSLEKGAISEIIQSSFGFHIVTLTDKKAPVTKSLAEARTELENELRPVKINALLTKRANELEDLLAGGSTLDQAAKELGLTVQSFGPFDDMARAPDGSKLALPALANFAALAFSTEEGADSNVTSGNATTLYLLHVDKVQPETLPDIAKVKNELVSGWKTSRRDTLERAEAEDLAAKLADTKSRAEVLKSGDLKRLGAGSINREDTKLAGRDLSAVLAQDIFNTEIGGVTNASQLADGQYAIALVQSASMPALLDDAAYQKSEEAKQLRASIKNNMQQELMGQYMDAISNRLGVEIDEDALSSIEME